MKLYHYCPNAAFISIVSNKEIWASDFSHANDFMEGKWIREIFRDHCTDKKISKEQQAELIRHLDTVIDLARTAGFCMSEDGDLLSQWRGYADNGAGVSIGFSKEYFDALGILKRDRNDAFNASLTKVVYNPTDQKKLIAEVLDPILALVNEGALRGYRTTIISVVSEEERAAQKKKYREMYQRFIFFFFHLYSLKNPAFAEEREWRIISHIIITKDEPDEDLKNLEFRATQDRIVRYRRIALEDLSQPTISEVVLGPKNLANEEIVEQLLKKNGWGNVTIRRSSASYR
jgi:hypothetical protein